MAVALRLPIDPPTVRVQVERLSLEANGRGGEVPMIIGTARCTECDFDMSVVMDADADIDFGYCPRPGCGAAHYFEPNRSTLTVHGEAR